MPEEGREQHGGTGSRGAVLVIEAGKEDSLYWRDLWHYRELFFFLAWRDLKVRYRQTLMGAGWAIIRPLVTMVIFTVLFGKIACLPSENVPYPLLVFAGLLPWQFFSSAVGASSMSLLGNSHLLTKVYFPRLVILGSSILVCLVDFLITLVLFLVLCLYFGFIPGLHLLLLPFCLLPMMVFSFGLGIILATLSVRYRDFAHVTPFLLQIMQYVSPVGYSSQVIPDPWKALFACNPLVGIIDGFRFALLGKSGAFLGQGMALSLFISCAILVVGILSFRKQERTFADFI